MRSINQFQKQQLQIPEVGTDCLVDKDSVVPKPEYDRFIKMKMSKPDMANKNRESLILYMLGLSPWIFRNFVTIKQAHGTNHGSIQQAQAFGRKFDIDKAIQMWTQMLNWRKDYGNVIFNENRSGRLFIKSFVKTNLKSLCYFSFKIYFIYLSESCHVFQYGIIAPGLSTQKNPHLTKPTPKLPVPNAMGQKRSKINYLRANLTHELSPFATREPGQPSVQGWGMTTISYTDPDASLSLLRQVGVQVPLIVVKDL
ncbi:hypothetical protein LXL04_022417 [Taraxacum kok-saghyz]